jgi:hypothetical protein
MNHLIGLTGNAWCGISPIHAEHTQSVDKTDCPRCLKRLIAYSRGAVSRLSYLWWLECKDKRELASFIPPSCWPEERDE